MNWITSFYNVLGNKKVEIIPFIPRFDLWYNAQSIKDNKLDILKNVTSVNEFSKSLGLIPYSNIPDFSGGGDFHRVLHRSLGFYNLKQCPYKINFNKVKVRFKKNEDSIFVEYITPFGIINTEFMYSKKMLNSGISLGWIKKRLIKKNEDFFICKYIFDDMIIEENFKEFDEFIITQGDDYIPIASGLMAISGMQHIMRDFMEITDFYFYFMDNKEILIDLANVSFFTHIVPVFH